VSITGVRHVALTVSDLDRSASWYAGVLGLIELFHESYLDRSTVILRVPESRVLVGLVQFTAPEPGRFAPQRVGLDHLCFAVATGEEMLTWICRLEEHGIAHSGVLQMKTGPIVNFTDPDGIALSFALPPPLRQ